MQTFGARAVAGAWLLGPSLLTVGAHAHAARVTVVVLCVCLSVCLSVCLFLLSATILVLQATRRLMNDTDSFSATRARKIMWRFR